MESIAEGKINGDDSHVGKFLKDPRENSILRRSLQPADGRSFWVHVSSVRSLSLAVSREEFHMASLGDWWMLLRDFIAKKVFD